MEKRETEDKLLNESLQYMEMLSIYRRGLKLAEFLDPESVWRENVSVFMEECDADGCILAVNERGRFNIKHIKGEVNLQEYEKEVKEGNSGKVEIREGGKVLRIKIGEDKQPLGFVILFRKGREFTAKEVARAKILEKFAGISIKNAITFLRYQEESLKTSPRIYTPIFFSEYIEKEIHKARRYGRKFSLIFMKIDNYASLLKNLPREVIEENLVEVLKIVSQMIRSADVFSKLADDEFLILLPETGYTGAFLARVRIDKLLENRFHLVDGRRVVPVKLFTSSVSYPHDGLSFGALLDVLKSRAQFFRTETFNIIREDVESLLDKVRENADRIKSEVERFSAYFSHVSINLSEFRRFVMTFIEEMKLREDFEKPLFFCSVENADLRALFEKEKNEMMNRGIVYQVVNAGKFNFTFILYLEKSRGYTFLGNFSGDKLDGFHTDSLLFTESVIKSFMIKDKISFE